VNCRCTLEIYSQARLQAKREAQHWVVELIIPWEREATETELPLIVELARQGMIPTPFRVEHLRKHFSDLSKKHLINVLPTYEKNGHMAL